MARQTNIYIRANDKKLQHEWLIEMFLEYLKAEGKTQKTLKNYESDLRIFFTWYEENATLKGKSKGFEKIKVQDIIKLQAYLLDKGMSINRYSRLKSVISSLSNYCENILAEDIDYEEFKGFRNIVNKVKKPVKEAVREKTILTEEQIEQLLNKLIEQQKFQMACALALAVYGGSRKAELLEFKVSYFDVKNIKFGSLYKTPEKIRTKGKMLEKYTIVNKFKPYFDLWMNHRKENNIESEWLFIKKEDGEWRKAKESQLNYYAEVFSDMLGIDFYWHSCRHNFCTYLLEQGLPEAVVTQVIGWSNSTMIEIYDDRDKDEMLGNYFKDGEIINKDKKNLSDL